MNQQLQQEIQATQEKLKKLQEKLESSKVTIENAPVGAVLPDGCIVVERYKDSILIAAPESTGVKCTWTPEFKDVFTSLKNHGFNPSQWHVPSQEELQLTYKNCKEQFSSAFYWSSTENSSMDAFGVRLGDGRSNGCLKTYACHVRAFRCVYLGFEL